MGLKYAKIIPGGIEPAPNSLTIGEQTVVNPTEEQYRDAGWLPYASTDYPDVPNGMTAVSRYEEQDGHIVQMYDMIPDRSEMGAEEIMEAVLPTIINNAPMEDAIALRCKRFHPTFTQLCKRGKKKAPKGFRFVHNGDLYKTAGASTDFVSHYAPGPGMESMYTRIDEVHSGTKYDPIPYDGNMELMEGLHYQQDGVVYVCVRPTLAPVFDRLDKLATVQGGEYVKAV